MTYKLSNTAEDDLYRTWHRGVREYGVERADSYFNALFTQFYNTSYCFNRNRYV